MMLRFNKLANLFILLVFISDSAKATGMSIKLIHRHSVDSPFYPGNLKRSQRIKLHLRSSSAYATWRWLSNVTSSSSLDIKYIRPRLKNQFLMYIIEVGMGTFPPPRSPYYRYFLHLDTANDLTWTQCEECRRMGRHSCFLQAAPLFPAGRSRTYRPLPCDRHQLCSPGHCINTTCAYSILYGDNAFTTGYLASESLTFTSDKNRDVTIRDVVFGCGIKNIGFKESSRTNLVAGNFGLGPGKRSFLIQKKKSVTLGRFSYCLPPIDAMHKTTIFLRFGGDIKQRRGLQSTPLKIYPNMPFYFVELRGISVGKTRVNIPQPVIAPDQQGRGGCIVDSGTTMSLLPPLVYEKLTEVLIKNHLSSYKRTRNMGILKFCYSFPRNGGIKDLPNITFHLQDADLVMPPRLLYVGGKNVFGRFFCLAMFPEDMIGLTVIGAFQQSDTRFIFDTVKQKLYFGPEDCSLGA